MGLIADAFRLVWRDYVTDGVPSSGKSEPKKADIRNLGSVIEQQVVGASAGKVLTATWSGLSAINGTRAGQPGEVPTTDTGSHTDPVVGGTVPNSGIFAWSTSPAGWRRVGSVVDADSIETSINDLESGLTTETTDREQGDQTLQTAISGEAAARQAAVSNLQKALDEKPTFGDMDERIADAGYYGARERPGDVRELFTSSLAGAASSLAPIAQGAPVTTDDGRVWRFNAVGPSPQIIADRKDFAIEPGNVYAARWFLRRIADTTDPLGDAVELGIAWLSSSKQFLSETIVDSSALMVSSGRKIKNITFSLDEEADFPAHSAARYCRAFIRVFGNTGVTDIVSIKLWESNGLPGPAGSDGDLTEQAQELRDEVVAAAADVEAAKDEIDGYLGPRLAQRSLSAPRWNGGLPGAPVDPSWRIPEVADLKRVESGLFGDLPLIAWLRTHGLPIEIEYFNGQYFDAQLAAQTLIETHRPPVVIFGYPTYLMKSAIDYDLIKDITLRSHTAGISAPPTMIFENPAHTPFSFAAGNDNVRLEGVWSIKHRQKPTTALTVQFSGGCKNIYIDTLVCLNANQAVRFDDCDNIHIGTLVTDADTAFSANANATRVRIGQHIKIGSRANVVTGAEYVSIGAPSAGLWTPTIDFDTHGDLSVSYSNTAAFFERIGKQVFVHGSITFTPTFTTAAGAFRLGGLPFNAKAGSEAGFVGINSMSAITWPTIAASVATQCALTVSPGTKFMRLVGQRSGGGTGNFSVTHIVSGTAVTLRFSGFYEAEV